MKSIRVFKEGLTADESPPIWLMRQAGRYLPEYKRVRAEVGGFLDLCYTPDKAAEVTLQPIDRFDFDAAILFSDILVVPHALGQEVRFVEGEGPRLDPIRSVSELPGLGAGGHDRFERVYEAVGLIRSRLSKDKALIGFCGAPTRDRGSTPSRQKPIETVFNVGDLWWLISGPDRCTAEAGGLID